MTVVVGMPKLIDCWAETAARHAMLEPIGDPPGVFAAVAGIQGPWAFGDTRDEALAELKSVLADWAALKLEDGDDDIPDMEGVRLVAAPLRL